MTEGNRSNAFRDCFLFSIWSAVCKKMADEYFFFFHESRSFNFVFWLFFHGSKGVFDLKRESADCGWNIYRKSFFAPRGEKTQLNRLGRYHPRWDVKWRVLFIIPQKINIKLSLFDTTPVSICEYAELYLFPETDGMGVENSLNEI